MPKILEIITEPDKIYAGEKFKLKIKVNLSVTYKQIKDKGLTYADLKEHKYKDFVMGVEKNAIK